MGLNHIIETTRNHSQTTLKPPQTISNHLKPLSNNPFFPTRFPNFSIPARHDLIPPERQTFAGGVLPYNPQHKQSDADRRCSQN